jgi:hypothetical protein
MKLAIVTASTDLVRAEPCLRSWMETATTKPYLFVELNGQIQPTPGIFRAQMDAVCPLQANVQAHTEYLGTVKAFLAGTSRALGTDADIIACLHDDLLISEPGWDDKVLEHFRRHPHTGLLGFGGAIGLGDDDLYRKPYAPVQLARKGFRSNMQNAEAHGLRSTLAEQVACLDGFSQIGRRAFWEGLEAPNHERLARWPVWQQLDTLGVVHHAYDAMLGCLAARAGWDVWYLPVACHHLGGQTAVGDPAYQAWAKTQAPGGDEGFWEHAHAICYKEFRSELPIRV